MIRKILPLCVAVVMLAGMAQAAEWPHVSFDATTSLGTLTVHQVDLDQVGSPDDVTSDGITTAVSGDTDWSRDMLAAGDNDQSAPRDDLQAGWDTGQFDPFTFNQEQWLPDHPDLLMEVTVPAGTYDVYAIWYGQENSTTRGVYARTSETDPWQKFTWTNSVALEKQVNPSTTDRYVMASLVDTVSGTTLPLYTTRDGGDGGLSLNYFGMAYKGTPNRAPRHQLVCPTKLACSVGVSPVKKGARIL